MKKHCNTHYKLMKIILLCCTLLTTLTIWAQYPEAENLFNTQCYAAAEQLYLQLLTQHPNDGTLNYRVGRCRLEQGNYSGAVNYLEKAAATLHHYPKVYQTLTECYYALYRFDDATAMLERYIAESGDSTALSRMPQLRMAASMLESTEQIDIIDSLRVHKRNLLIGYHLSPDVGKLDYTVSDSNMLMPATSFISGRADRKITAVPDNNGLNLYISYKMLNGWSTAAWLPGDVNSDSAENFPFVTADGVTLYFASTGHHGLGGYDIFMSNDAASGFRTPHNIGMPFNSPDNDYLLVIDEVQNIGWFATDRRQAKDSVMIYTFVPNTRHTKIESNDSVRRLAAQLRLYNIAKYSSGQSNRSDSQSAHPNTVQFIINDTCVYHSERDFHTDEGRTFYLQHKAVLAEKQKAMKHLEQLRKHYAEILDSKERIGIAQCILKMEQALEQYAADAKRYAAQARAAEINFFMQQ